jgi:hypothetical protein
MIVRIVMKTPDVLFDECNNEAGKITPQRDARKEIANEAYEYICNKWMRYGEYLTVEFDTEKGTAMVIQQ